MLSSSGLSHFMDADFPQTLPGDVMVRILTVITFLAGGPAGPKRLRTEWNIKSPASVGTKLMCPSSPPPAVRAGDKVSLSWVFPTQQAMFYSGTLHDVTHSALTTQNNLMREAYLYPLRSWGNWGLDAGYILCVRSERQKVAELGFKPTLPVLVFLTTAQTACSQFFPNGHLVMFSRVWGNRAK